MAWYNPEQKLQHFSFKFISHYIFQVIISNVNKDKWTTPD